MIRATDINKKFPAVSLIITTYAAYNLFILNNENWHRTEDPNSALYLRLRATKEIKCAIEEKYPPYF